MRFYFFVIALSLVPVQAFTQQNIVAKDPTIALENFNFKAIDYTTLDSVSYAYTKAIEHSLYHRFDQAEILMKKVALHSESPLCGAARYLLLNELYFWRGKYTDYVQFADQINERQGLYTLAKSLIAYPAIQISFPTDSILIPVAIRKHSYVIANAVLNGKPVRLMLDSGANFSIISQKLNDELQLVRLTELDFQNSVGTTFTGAVNMLDSLLIGNITIKNTPISCTAKSRFFKRLHIDGLLGWDILRKISYTANFKDHTLLIRRPVIDTTAEKNLFGIRMPLMVVNSTSGNRLNMFFDSGSNSVDLNTRGSTKLGDYSTLRRLGMASGIGKTRIGLFRYVKNFTFYTAGYPFTRKQTYITPIEWVILSIKCDGILSNAPFQKGQLTIDYLNNHFDYRK